MSAQVTPWGKHGVDQLTDEMPMAYRDGERGESNYGFISFEDKGDLIVSPVADRASLVKRGLREEGKVNVGVFSEGQRGFSSITGRMC